MAEVKLDPALSGSAANLVRLGCSLMASGKGGQAVATASECSKSIRTTRCGARPRGERM